MWSLLVTTTTIKNGASADRTRSSWSVRGKQEAGPEKLPLGAPSRRQFPQSST